MNPNSIEVAGWIGCLFFVVAGWNQVENPVVSGCLCGGEAVVAAAETCLAEPDSIDAGHRPRHAKRNSARVSKADTGDEGHTSVGGQLIEHRPNRIYDRCYKSHLAKGVD